MKCYIRDFGIRKLAVCEEITDDGAIPTVTQPLHSEPTPELWAQLGALLARTSEVIEAQ